MVRKMAGHAGPGKVLVVAAVALVMVVAAVTHRSSTLSRAKSGLSDHGNDA